VIAPPSTAIIGTQVGTIVASRRDNEPRLDAVVDPHQRDAMDFYEGP
jgi:hypothetical protein